MPQPSPLRVSVQSFGYAEMKGTRHLPQQWDVGVEGSRGDRRYFLVDPFSRTVIRTISAPQLLRVKFRTDGGGRAVAEFPAGGVRIPETVEVQLPEWVLDAAGTESPGRGVPQGLPQAIPVDYWGEQRLARLASTVLDEAFSDFLGQSVRVARADVGRNMVYDQPLTLIGTASIADLAERSGHDALPEQAARFRANLVIDTHEPYIEDSWRGRVIEVPFPQLGVPGSSEPNGTPVLGDATRIQIGAGVPRCAVIDHHPETGEKDARLLKTLASYRPRNTQEGPQLAVYGRVVG